MWTPDLVTRAACFAAVAHKDQRRKYTGEPYVVHCIEVAAIVATVSHNEDMLAAAYLHDVIEDCGISADTIALQFSKHTAFLVECLTDVSTPADGNRAARKARDRASIANAPAAAKTIKLADLISNSRTIVAFDPGFARVYMREKLALLEVLREGSTDLYEQACTIVANYFENEPEEI